MYDSAHTQSAGGILAKMLDPQGRLNVHAMRPFMDENGESRIVINAAGHTVRTNVPSLLRYDEFKDIDRVVLEVAVTRLVGIKRLIAKGLTHALGSIGLTISLWDKSSDLTDASISMSGITKGEEDTPAFEPAQVPVPIVHKDFRLNIRRLIASRMAGEGLDVMAPAMAARKVAERSEDMLFAGAAVQVDGSTIYGYTTHPQRNTVDLVLNWDDPSATGQDIVDDVQAMLQAARDDNYFGPFCLYVPGNYEGTLDNDFAFGSGDTRTVRQRIMQLSGISDIVVADRLADDNVVLVQETRDVADLAIAEDIKTVQWQMDGGMQERFKVMAVWVPRIKSDYDGKSGIVHLAAI